MAKKLFGALNENGLLIFSTHGVSCMQNPNEMPENGFLYLNMSESKSLSFEEYGTTYVSNGFVTKTIKKVTGQEAEFVMEKYLWNYQDVYVVRRPVKS